jgi:hypothetical protein
MEQREWTRGHGTEGSRANRENHKQISSHTDLITHRSHHKHTSSHIERSTNRLLSAHKIEITEVEIASAASAALLSPRYTYERIA